MTNGSHSMTYQPPTGPEFRGLMDRWGLSYREVAKLLAVHRRTPQRWALGEVAVPFAAIAALAAFALEKRVWPDTWREQLGLSEPSLRRTIPSP